MINLFQVVFLLVISPSLLYAGLLGNHQAMSYASVNLQGSHSIPVHVSTHDAHGHKHEDIDYYVSSRK